MSWMVLPTFVCEFLRSCIFADECWTKFSFDSAAYSVHVDIKSNSAKLSDLEFVQSIGI